jgi:hypothetical protein
MPSTFLSSLQQCDRRMVPTIRTIFNIAVVIPLSVAKPERTFSALCILKTYLRSRSSENRLNGLALICFNSASAADVQDVINHFVNVKNRRLALLQVLKHE